MPPPNDPRTDSLRGAAEQGRRDADDAARAQEDRLNRALGKGPKVGPGLGPKPPAPRPASPPAGASIHAPGAIVIGPNTPPRPTAPAAPAAPRPAPRPAAPPVFRGPGNKDQRFNGDAVIIGPNSPPRTPGERSPFYTPKPPKPATPAAPARPGAVPGAGGRGTQRGQAQPVRPAAPPPPGPAPAQPPGDVDSSGMARPGPGPSIPALPDGFQSREGHPSARPPQPGPGMRGGLGGGADLGTAPAPAAPPTGTISPEMAGGTPGPVRNAAGPTYRVLPAEGLRPTADLTPKARPPRLTRAVLGDFRRGTGVWTRQAAERADALDPKTRDRYARAGHLLVHDPNGHGHEIGVSAEPVAVSRGGWPIHHVWVRDPDTKHILHVGLLAGEAPTPAATRQDFGQVPPGATTGTIDFDHDAPTPHSVGNRAKGTGIWSEAAVARAQRQQQFLTQRYGNAPHRITTPEGHEIGVHTIRDAETGVKVHRVWVRDPMTKRITRVAHFAAPGTKVPPTLRLARAPAGGEHDAFHNAVSDALRDGTPRHVYADWLGDRGDLAHSEIVRRHAVRADQMGTRLNPPDAAQLEAIGKAGGLGGPAEYPGEHLLWTAAFPRRYGVARARSRTTTYNGQAAASAVARGAGGDRYGVQRFVGPAGETHLISWHPAGERPGVRVSWHGGVFTPSETETWLTLHEPETAASIRQALADLGYQSPRTDNTRLARPKAFRSDGPAAAVQTSATDNAAKQIELLRKVLNEAGVSQAAVNKVLTAGQDGGVRSAVMAALRQDVPRPVVKYLAGWWGLIGRQPAVTVFHPGEGADLLHLVHAPQSQPAVVAKAFTGIGGVTINPRGGGSLAYIYDPAGRAAPAVAQAAEALGARHSRLPGSGYRLGAGPGAAADSRAAYRSAIRTFEQTAVAAGPG